jgi:hypothetical protein
LFITNSRIPRFFRTLFARFGFVGDIDPLLDGLLLMLVRVRPAVHGARTRPVQCHRFRAPERAADFSAAGSYAPASSRCKPTERTAADKLAASVRRIPKSPDRSRPRTLRQIAEAIVVDIGPLLKSA